MKKLLFASLISLSLASAPALAVTPNAANFNRAVMQAYDEMIRENYKDYEALFRRANEYYNHGDYLKALDDLDNALKYTPAKNTDLLFSIYALRAQCFSHLKRFSQALPEANEALKLNGTSTPMLNLRAEIEYDLGKYDLAKADYNKVLRINPRNQDAMFGLALIASKENNHGLASDYMEQGVNVAPQRSNSYVRRAQVKEQMGDYNGAVDDLLVAMATDSSDPNALPALVGLANSNYSAVASGLSSAIRKAPRQPLYYFLRASIAQAHFHYGAAISDFEYIIKENLYNYAGLYCSLAECYYALNNYDKALDCIDSALAKYTDEDDPCRYFTVRARIQRAMKDYDKAILSVNRALDIKAEDADAMVEKALVLTNQKKAKEASELLGQVILNDPYPPMPYMLRAWVMNDYLNQPEAAKKLYERVIDLEPDHSERVGSLIGFARLFAGQTPRAISWMDAILAEPDNDGLNHYYGACFYAWAGKSAKALECMEASLKAGYANYHDWASNCDARINVEPIRDNARFKELLEQYKSIFEY